MKKFLMSLAVVAMFASCSTNDDSQQSVEGIDIGSAVVGGLKSIPWDFTKPSVYTFADEAEKERLIKEINDEIFKIDLNTYQMPDGSFESDEISFNMVINEDSRTITLTPLPLIRVPIVSQPGGGQTPTGNEECGEGAGWKKYGTCYSAECVENKLREAAEDLNASKIKNGQCFETRTKRNKMSATVCARVVSC